ncbi:MAG: hypothetical protein ABIP51_07855 [Bacteroidia bacterium]
MKAATRFKNLTKFDFTKQIENKNFKHSYYVREKIPNLEGLDLISTISINPSEVSNFLFDILTKDDIVPVVIRIKKNIIDFEKFYDENRNK